MVKTIKTLVGISLICCMLFGVVLISLTMTELRPIATDLAPQQTVRGLHTPGPHAKILIDGNADFASQASSQGWSGDGSPGTPYVISDYVIRSPYDPAVFIIDTNVHFIIENVTVRDTRPSEGFKLYNVTNGELRNNMAINASAGFVLYSAPNNILSGNTAINCSDIGFSAYYSQNNNLINNTAKNIYGSGANGFYLSNSPNNNLINNTARDCDTTGFKLDGSSNNILNNNTALFNKQGFYISGSDNTLTKNTARSNVDDGFKLQSCSLNTLIHNTATLNDLDGFRLDNASQNALISNIATDNTYNGFSLINASQNILVHNTATNNDDYGLHLTYSNYNTFEVNILSPNKVNCIYDLGSIGNVFIGNTCDEGEIPGFNLAILIGMLAVISVVFFLRKHQFGRLTPY